MRLKNVEKKGLFMIFIVLMFAGCKSTVNEISVSTCKAVETNNAKCNQLIADDISDKNAKTPSSINEGDL